MGNLREFVLKKKGNTNGHELATNFHELILRPVHRFQQVLQCI